MKEIEKDEESKITGPRKTISLVAHDNRKKDMVEWVEWNYFPTMLT